MSAEPSEATQFDWALDHGNLPKAWMHAHNLRRVSLDRALRLTILIGLEEDDPAYLPACRRFLRRFLRECEPTMGQVKKVTDALDCLPREDRFVRQQARDALDDLARQIES